MEQTTTAQNLWRVWVDTRPRFGQPLEFRDRDLFFSCIEQYTGMQYRYQ